MSEKEKVRKPGLSGPERSYQDQVGTVCLDFPNDPTEEGQGGKGVAYDVRPRNRQSVYVPSGGIRNWGYVERKAMVEPRGEEVHHRFEPFDPHGFENLWGESPFRMEYCVRTTERVRQNVELAWDVAGY